MLFTRNSNLFQCVVCECDAGCGRGGGGADKRQFAD